VTLVLPQFISVTMSPTFNVSASSPSMSALGEYQTFLVPTSAFCQQNNHTFHNAFCGNIQPFEIDLSGLLLLQQLD